MSYSTRNYASGYASRNWFPTGVKWLLIVNTALFLLYFFAVRFGGGEMFGHFGLVPSMVVKTFAIWQLFTYMFLHSPYGFEHILFNMLSLWMFGKDIENAWGTQRFLRYYFICGIGAGFCVVIANYLFGTRDTRTIGASGAIYGVLLAFAMVFPDVQVLFSFIFPMKAKYMVAIIGAIAFLSSFNANSGVSNVAHLGGMLVGYIYLKSQAAKRVPTAGAAYYKPSRQGAGRKGGLLQSLKDKYQAWKIARAKKKFQVYLKKHGGQDPWVN